MSYKPLFTNTNPQTEFPGQPQQPPSIPPSSLNSTFNTNQPVTQMNPVPQFFQGFKYGYVDDPLVELGQASEALIHQKPQFEEQFLGCQFPNRYFVFTNSLQYGKKMLFKCKEQSECCQRNCCCASVREFSMAIKHVKPHLETDDSFDNTDISAYKPCKCTCFCLERPIMNVFTNRNTLVGIVKQPFSCCDPIFTINDPSGVIKYYIWADCCQCGYCCGNNICGKLSEVWFNIYNDPGRTEKVGNIIKKVAKFSEMITNADSYLINFPSKATPADKLLLITAGLMIDYQFFENSPESPNQSHGTYRQAI